MQVPKRRSEQNIKRDTDPLMITADGLARLQAELASLEKEVPHMIFEVERTKEFGDFSENAAYQDAKATLRRTYSRIASLKDRIKRAVIIQREPGSANTVQIGSRVIVESKGKQVTFEILGHQETDPSQGIISDRSPLGKALLDHRAGYKVIIQTKNGGVEHKIISVE